MKQLTIYSSLLAVFLLLQGPITFAQMSEDWTQFRGPSRSGISAEKITDANATDPMPELVWKKDIGCAFSEITISGDKLYTTLSEKTDSLSGWEYMAAFDAKTGNELWRNKIDSIFIDKDDFGDGPRSTPLISKDAIFSFSSYGKLTAHSKTDGKQLWQVDFIKEFGSTTPRWGFSSSPVMVDGVLIIEAGGTEERAFTAFDPTNGKLLWAKGKGNASYCSPLVAEIDGQTQIIFANQRTLSSYNSKGEVLWSFAMKMNGPTSMPTLVDANKIFVSTVRSSGFIVVEVKGNTVTELLKAPTMKNDYSSTLYYDGHFYGFNVAALQCISAETGEKKWTKRGFGKGSLILVGDKLLVLSDKGQLIQVKATPDVYTEQRRFQAIQGKSWTAPSFVNGKLYLRNQTEMACYKFN
ncbi:PQQ-binding-like beta-propeller repeat protein [Ancylomarina sp. DW003]|nr:PQQ-binding-like beta-propeller repeat protein [Ancylomarina sp. DW003]MDE5422649.1 PQQ-binding-like beta-propeller repeat protein [Ancylomarina sp. DW003]